jgi:DNA-binding Lrp family transcriptional regulator
MYETLASGSYKKESLSRKAYVLIRTYGADWGIHLRNGCNVFQTHGAWDYVIEFPIENLEKLREEMEEIKSNGNKTEIESTFTMVGFGKYPSKESDSSKLRAYTILKFDQCIDLNRVREDLYKIPEIRHATPVYGPWDLVLESEFSDLKELDKLGEEIRKGVPAYSLPADGITTLIQVKSSHNNRSNN